MNNATCYVVFVVCYDRFMYVVTINIHVVKFPRTLAIIVAGHVGIVCGCVSLVGYLPKA